MAKTTARTGTAPFAHLLALVTGKPITGKKADDDGIEPEDEGEIDQNEVDEALDDADVDDVQDGDDAKKGKRKAKKAAKADDDEPYADEDGGYDDEEKASAYRAGIAAGSVRENTRCKAIFSADAAGLRPDVAAQLAFGTRQTAAEAIGVLNAVAAPTGRQASRNGLADRMSARRDPQPPAGASGGGKPTFGERAAAAAKKVGLG